jgi:hypothetical protein
VYAVSGDTWLQRAWAGILIGGPEATIGQHGAAYLSSLIDQRPKRIDVYVGRRSTLRSDPRWRFIRAARDGADCPRRTSPAQTLIDMAPHLTADDLAALLIRATSDRRVKPQAVLEQLSRVRHHPQRSLIQDILADAVDGTGSALKVRYDRDVELPHGLPVARRQARPSGRHWTDREYEGYGTIVELDGYVYHRGVAACHDLDRDNLHRLINYVTLRFTWGQVAGNPCAVATQVAAALHQRGWQGSLSRCHRCPPDTRR